MALDILAINVMNAKQAILIWMEMTQIRLQVVQVNTEYQIIGGSTAHAWSMLDYANTAQAIALI